MTCFLLFLPCACFACGRWQTASPLHLACRALNYDVIKLLLDTGRADVNATDEKVSVCVCVSSRCFWFSCIAPALLLAVVALAALFPSSPDLVDMRCACLHDVFGDDSQKRTPLVAAIRSNNLKLAQTLLAAVSACIL